MNLLQIKNNVSILALSILCLFSCTKGDRFDYDKEAILLTGTEVNPMVRFVVENTPSTYTVTASATGKVAEDISIDFVYDETKLEEYNKNNNTNFYAVPSGAIVLEGSNGVIKAGSASSTGIDIKVVSIDQFIDGRTYVIPISIKNVTGGNLNILESSRTIFLRISRVSNFYSLDMNNTALYSNFIFNDDQAVNLDKYTYEVKCYINNWHSTPEPISRLCSFTSKDEQRSNMLRFGENGQAINSLQWVNPGGSLISKTRFNTQQWYTISLSYDGSKFTMYVDGVPDSEMAGSGNVTFQRFELGMSWANYPSMQYFNGRIAEVRVWDKALTSGEIRNGICGVDPTSENLVAYWKFNEMDGHIFHDASGNGYDMDWSNTYRDNAGNGVLNRFDKRSAVRWLIDDNNKCTQ
ncbi:DUF1735 domain-containing protein [Sphingobacterium alkalisoli]|uniref:DUF1735 domain-containing protein n=1 Tax=Sphingobacterium alkalisoli TaxID=1874115 RepID=A0A4U0GYR5_9SPHI|nr:DUF1735 and LamG domain-containing protein [Sphingobacterium alkalisoli]TJY64335.1 DUF1735 domain-containing protein [Sphingobacterium alkalisoli]GGH22361.1 hypothetical protein GCM10011418_28870 [Sphingobacterium alkalisoli]